MGVNDRLPGPPGVGAVCIAHGVGVLDGTQVPPLIQKADGDLVVFIHCVNGLPIQGHPQARARVGVSQLSIIAGQQNGLAERQGQRMGWAVGDGDRPFASANQTSNGREMILILDTRQRPRQVHRASRVHLCLHLGQPLIFSVCRDGGQFGAQALGRLEVIEQGHLPQDAYHDSVFLQRLAQYVLPVVVHFPVLTSVDLPSIAPPQVEGQQSACQQQGKIKDASCGRNPKMREPVCQSGRRFPHCGEPNAHP